MSRRGPDELARDFTLFVKQKTANGPRETGALAQEFRQSRYQATKFPPEGFASMKAFVTQKCPDLIWEPRGRGSGGRGKDMLRYRNHSSPRGRSASVAGGGNKGGSSSGSGDARAGGAGRLEVPLANGNGNGPIDLEEERVVKQEGEENGHRNSLGLRFSLANDLAHLAPGITELLETAQPGNFMVPPSDLSALLEILPRDLQHLLAASGAGADLVSSVAEFVFDLGRPPYALFTPAELGGVFARRDLGTEAVDEAMLTEIVTKLGQFGKDNRAGIRGTLHRISRRLNLQGKLIGLTIRAGRSLGKFDALLREELDAGCSILFVGKPGSGKTTLIRDCAAHLSTRRRVEIIDTSNEIAGHSDVPHQAVGMCRRLMVSDRTQQHAVMLEAVQNHTPQTVVIDEIGTEEEVDAVRDISSRGIQLVASAHGAGISDILSSPILMKLMGDVHTVILNAEEVREQGRSSRTKQERKAKPSFDVLVEIEKPGCVVVVKTVSQAVDASLEGLPFDAEVRTLKQDEHVEVKYGTMSVRNPRMDRMRREE